MGLNCILLHHSMSNQESAIFASGKSEEWTINLQFHAPFGNIKVAGLHARAIFAWLKWMALYIARGTGFRLQYIVYANKQFVIVADFCYNTVNCHISVLKM